MYQDMTYDAILGRMLKTALSTDGSLDTREGSLVWLGQAPAAVELQNLYIALDSILDETFADTASRNYLVLRAAERGLSPQAASPAILELSVLPANLSLPMNTRFSVGGVNYYVSRAVGNGVYEITCETAGEIGNDYTQAVIPIEYVSGLERCTVTALLAPGEDEEDTEAFRKRYLDSMNAQAFGGNQIDYVNRINALPGVGGVKVYRAWNDGVRASDLIPPDGAGDWLATTTAPDEIKAWLNAVYQTGTTKRLNVGGVIKAVIIDSTHSAPSDALIDQVQTAIDPTQNAGEGVGIAPIGHVVKVEGVQSECLDLSFRLSFQKGWDWADIKDAAEASMDQYFKELAALWAGQVEGLVVRISQIESRLLDIDGVLDIDATTINGVAANVTLADDHIPVLGAIALYDETGG